MTSEALRAQPEDVAAAEAAIRDNVALLVLAGNVTLEQFEQSSPGIVQAIASRAAEAAIASAASRMSQTDEDDDDWPYCSSSEDHVQAYQRVVITNASQKDGYDRALPHAATTACAKRACVLEGLAWVERQTGEQAVWRSAGNPDAVWSSKPPATDAQAAAIITELSPTEEVIGAEWHVEWHIDDTDNHTTPAAAARAVWDEYFGGYAPGPDDSCVFVVTDSNTDRSVSIDLGEDLEDDGS